MRKYTFAALFLIFSVIVAFLAFAPTTVHAQETALCRGPNLLYYNINTQSLDFVEYDAALDRIGGVLQTVETNIKLNSVKFLGWSTTCRYFAAILYESGKSINTLVVWDAASFQRVGLSESPYTEGQEIRWNEDDTIALLETHAGAFFWYIQTGSRVLVSEQVAIIINSRTVTRSFHQIAWDVARNVMIGVPVERHQNVAEYDLATGQQIVSYTGLRHGPVQFKLSPDKNWVALYNREGNEIRLLNRAARSDTALQLVPRSFRYNYSTLGWLEFSPDSHYMALKGDHLLAWDLSALKPDGAPSFAYYGAPLIGLRFIDQQTVQSGDEGLRLNLATGQYFDAAGNPVAAPTVPTTAETGRSLTDGRYVHPLTNGDCAKYYIDYDRPTRQLRLLNVETKAIIVLAENLRYAGRYGIIDYSPDCRHVYGRVAKGSLSASQNRIRNNGYDGMVFWSVETGERIAEYFYVGYVQWSPDGSAALITNFTGTHILFPAEKRSIYLQFNDVHPRQLRTLPLYPHAHWDFQRGIVLIPGWGETWVFDLYTGQQRGQLTPRPQEGGCYRMGDGCEQVVSEDNKTAFVIGDDAVGVYNLDTFQGVSVYNDLLSSLSDTNPFALSPDGRYLVTGYKAVRVWDLLNLSPEFEERTPIAQYAVPGTVALRRLWFSDGVNLQVETVEGTHYQLSLETGQFVPVE